MSKLIETQRLLLRPMLDKDFDEYLLYAMDPKVMQYIKPIGSRQEIAEMFSGFLKPWLGEEGQWMALAVELKDGGLLIGDVGFRYSSLEHQQIEIGYKFNRSFHGNGYGKEAVKAMVNLIINDWPFHKLVAYCDPRNTGSFKLMEHLGMQKEGHLKEHYKFGDSWQDELAYGVIKADIQL